MNGQSSRLIVDLVIISHILAAGILDLSAGGRDVRARGGEGDALQRIASAKGGMRYLICPLGDALVVSNGLVLGRDGQRSLSDREDLFHFPGKIVAGNSHSSCSGVDVVGVDHRIIPCRQCLPVHGDSDAGFLGCAGVSQILRAVQRNRQLRPAGAGSVGERTILAILFVAAEGADLTVSGGSFFVGIFIGVFALPHREGTAFQQPHGQIAVAEPVSIRAVDKVALRNHRVHIHAGIGTGISPKNCVARICIGKCAAADFYLGGCPG